MILKSSVTTVILCLAWIDGAFGTSYSKVYVNSGTNAGPYQYVRYGAPAVAYGPTIAQLSAPPVQSLVPFPQAASFVAQCVSPCVPQQTVTQVANAPLVAYTAPRARVVVAGDVPSNYEYSYVVYDDNTGDQKTARELSDGGVVRGQYSFLQPDGYVREVQYTADDATGFNAVVNYLPGSGDKTVEVKEAKPCVDSKPEAIKQGEAKKEDTGKKEMIDTKDTGEKTAEPVTESIASIEATMQFFSVDSTEVTSGEDFATGSSEEQVTEDPNADHEGEGMTESIASVEAALQFLTEVTAAENLSGSSEEQQTKEPATTEGAKVTEAAKPAGEEVTAKVTEEKPHTEPTVQENAVPAVVESVQTPPSVPAIVTNTPPAGFVSYDQLLKCIQKIQIADQRANSPLTYIIFPSNSKPC